MKQIPISEAAMQNCKRKADTAERAETSRGESRVRRYTTWHGVFDRCVDEAQKRKQAMNKRWRGRGLSGGKPTLMQEFVRAGESALAKLRRKRRAK